MKGIRIGYVRVSTVDQNSDRQLEGIDLDKKFTEHASGKNIQRKELEAMMNFVREGDIVLVHSIDRIARNLRNLKDIIFNLQEKGVSIQFLKENLTFKCDKEDPISNLLLNMMGAYAEFELSVLRERQREGIEIARAQNKYKREYKLSPEQQQEIATQISQHIPVAKLAIQYGVSRPTIYKCRKKDG